MTTVHLLLEYRHRSQVDLWFGYDGEGEGASCVWPARSPAKPLYGIKLVVGSLTRADIVTPLLSSSGHTIFTGQLAERGWLDGTWCRSARALMAAPRLRRIRRRQGF
jgi:hypothetical protein